MSRTLPVDPVIDLARHRAIATGVSGSRLGAPADVVRHLLAVQGQEFGPACWAVALRCEPSPARRELQQLCDDGSILRTHVLRPTWHFVLPEDLGWLLELTGPRVLAGTAAMYRREELDADTLDRATASIVDALEQRRGTGVTKQELERAVVAGGVELGGLRSSLIMLHAELRGVICSGPRIGKQHGYALLADRAPQTRRLSRDAAVSELVRRYFTSHGPATVHDLRWWSSLTIADIRAGIEDAGDALVARDHDGRTFYNAAPTPNAEGGGSPGQGVRLLPVYDEYVVAYTRSRWLIPPAVPARADGFDPGLASHVVVRDAAVIGEWRATERAGEVAVDLTLAQTPSASLSAELRSAAGEYAAFVEKDAVVTVGTSP